MRADVVQWTGRGAGLAAGAGGVAFVVPAAIGRLLSASSTLGRATAPPAEGEPDKPEEPDGPDVPVETAARVQA